jgi:hypothetical protein
VAHFREPNTVYSVSVTDNFSAYYYISFLPQYTAKVEADLPYGLMSIWTSYTTETKVIDGLLDSEITLNDGAPNPFVQGNAVMSGQRSYTIYAGKNEPTGADSRFASEDDDLQDPIVTNWLSTNSGKEEKISIIVLRIIGEYGNAEELSSSEWLPAVTLLDENGNKERCNLLRDQARYVTADTYNGRKNNGEKDGCNIYMREADTPAFSFYPLTEISVGFANSAGGGYIHADPEFAFTNISNPKSFSFAIEFKKPPKVFDPDVNQVYDEEAFDVRYTSLCLYVVGVVDEQQGDVGNNCITGVDIYNAFQQHGISYVLGGNDASAKQQAEKNGLPYLDLRESDSPYFVYRVLLANDASFDIDSNLPRWVSVLSDYRTATSQLCEKLIGSLTSSLRFSSTQQDGECDERVFNGFYKADNDNYLGEHAPIGRLCDSADLINNGCGFAGLARIFGGGSVRRLNE